jgi:S-adenosylmethionine decarboxylase
LYTLDKACVRAKSDQALEVIMTDLDPEIMKIFYQEYTNSAAEATKVRARRTRSTEQTVRLL